MVGRWVAERGGLIAVGGPINTLELARPRRRHQAQADPRSYPVVLSDIRISDFIADTNGCLFARLHRRDAATWIPQAQRERGREFLTDWEGFFDVLTAKGRTCCTAFYNCSSGREGQVERRCRRRFSDPKGKLKDNSLQPYLYSLAEQQSPRRLARLRRNLACCGYQRPLS